MESFLVLVGSTEQQSYNYDIHRAIFDSFIWKVHPNAPGIQKGSIHILCCSVMVVQDQIAIEIVCLASSLLITIRSNSGCAPNLPQQS